MQNLLDCDNREYTATIGSTLSGSVKIRGRITVEHGGVFLCQNEKKGTICSDKKGYKYSWYVGNGNSSDLMYNGVQNFKLLPRDLSTYQDWQVGDKIVCHSDDGIDRAEIIFRAGKLVVYEQPNGKAGNNYTCNELFNRGWRLDDPKEPKVLTFTIEEIAEKLSEKLGVSAEALKAILK